MPKTCLVEKKIEALQLTVHVAKFQYCLQTRVFFLLVAAMVWCFFSFFLPSIPYVFHKGEAVALVPSLSLTLPSMCSTPVFLVLAKRKIAAAISL